MVLFWFFFLSGEQIDALKKKKKKAPSKQRSRAVELLTELDIRVSVLVEIGNVLRNRF